MCASASGVTRFRVRRGRVAHGHVGEEPGGEQAAHAAPRLAGIVGLPRGDAERAHHDQGVHVHEPLRRDAADGRPGYGARGVLERGSLRLRGPGAPEREKRHRRQSER